MIRVDVTAQQVLHLGTRPDAGWLTDTHRFVPGSVLRGALAASWLAEHRPPSPDTTADPEFHRIFEGAVRFGPLYPRDDALYPRDDALRPLSVFGCKYATDPPCQNVAHDAAFEQADQPRCPACGGPMQASKGTIDGAATPAGHTRVQLDALERASDGQLFTRRALPRGTALTGLIDGDLDTDLRWLAGERLVRLGGRRCTSGLATLRCTTEPDPAAFTGLQPERRRLVLRLLSPAIFVDDLGRPCWLPDLAELQALLGVDTALAAAFARPALVTGWHIASNLPKPRDFAVAAGSVFVLRFDGDLPTPGALLRLWRRGLGLRRAEGNGWLSLQRWIAPTIRARSPRREPTEAERHARILIGHGLAQLVLADLRASAQDRATGSGLAMDVDTVLAKPRYRDLGPEARNAFVSGLTMTPEQTGELATHLDTWLRAYTRRARA